MKDEFEKQHRYFELGQTCFWLTGQNTIIEDELAPRLARARLEPAPRPLRILDLGCGPGNTLQRFQRWGTVVGFDFSVDALTFARTNGIARVVCGDSTALPIGPATVDCVLALDVIEHVEDDVAALGEIARVLRPGGLFIFTVPASMALWRYHDEAYGHCRRYSRPDFVAKVRRAGFDVRTCHFFKSVFYPPLWLLAKLERLGVIGRRENFFAIPGWLNRLLEAAIVWESRSGLSRRLPFGVSLLCTGHR